MDINEPLKLPCGVELKNRLIKASTTERMTAGDHKPGHLHYQLYKKWASSGVGTILTGNIMIDRLHLESGGNVVVDDERNLAALSEWAQIVKDAGVQLWAQINHPGRQCSRFINPYPVSAYDVGLKQMGLYGKPRALQAAEIEQLVLRFANTAEILKKANFSGIQLHAAHGYLLSQFLSPLTNKRGDQYGGSLENRARFLLESVAAVRSAVGKDFPVGVKLNSADFQKGGFDEDDSLQVIAWLENTGVDLVEVSGGNYESPALMGLEKKVRESTKKREAYFLDFARKVRKQSKIPLMLTGGFRSREVADRALQEGACDAIGMARPFLFDKNGIADWLEGKQTRLKVAPPKRSFFKLIDLMAEAGHWNYRIQKMARNRRLRKGPSPLRSAMHLLSFELLRALAHRRQNKPVRGPRN